MAQLTTHRIKGRNSQGHSPSGAGIGGDDVSQQFIDKAPEIGIVDRITNGLGTALNIGMLLPLVIPVAKGAIGAFSWASGKTGLASLEKAGRNAQGRITAFTEKSFGEVFGSNKVGSGIAKAANYAADKAGDAIDRAAKFTRVDKLASISKRRETTHFAKLGEQLSGFDKIEIPDKLKSHAHRIRDITKQQHAGLINIEELEKARGEFDSASKAYLKEMRNLRLKPASAKMAINSVNNIAETATRAANSHINYKSWGNVGGVVRDLPGAIAKSNVLSGAMNAGFIAASAGEMYGAARGFRQNLASLKEMLFDITGEKKSTFGALFGKVPEPVAEARSKLIKGIFISEATGAAGFAVSIANAVKGRMSALGFFGPQVAASLANTFIGESVLPYYASIKQAHSAGKAVPAEVYAELVLKSSPELQARGATGKIFANKLAEQYASMNASPGLVIKEASSGRNGALMQRVKGIMAENEIAKTAAATATTGRAVHTHVASLHEPHMQQREKPVVGNHTAQLVEKSKQAHAVTLGNV